MDFGNDFPSIVQYNNYSLAALINENCDALFAGAVNILPKERRKMLIRRFRFLVKSGIRCQPLQRADVDYAFILLGEYVRKHNLKRAFRNSWNDLLILATAIMRGASLVTRDTESDTPRRAGGLMSGAASKAVTRVCNL
jgi:predicted nucleic acid-binding protein